jgi:hypothetical protein
VSTAIDLGPESLLGVPEGAMAPELRDRLDLALRYLANWYKATKGSAEQTIWWLKIDQVRAKVEAAYKSFTPADLWLRDSAELLYNDAAIAFPGLWRDLTFSADTLPEPSLLSLPARVVDAVIETPGYLVHKIGKSLGDGIGGGLGALTEKLWPYALAAGVVIGVYVFRAPLLALVKKASG